MKIAVLASGGVDSSLALAMLASEGRHEITAYYLKIWLEDELHFLGECPWEEDLRYVRALCEQWDVPLRIVPLQNEYHERVVEYALRELRAGRTPSPDIWCNQFIKFGEFLEAIGDSYDRVATGHYAINEERDGLHWLKRSPDPVKDQSYFLVRLNQYQLSRAMFPVGHLLKEDVRREAARLQLPAMNRRDSQGICFLGKIQYREFVRFHLGEQDGPIIDIDTGKELGRHQGYWFYTIGQRQGLGLGGGPWYVAERDHVNNVIYVVHGSRLDDHARRDLVVADVRWIARPPEQFDLQLKLRHGPHLVPGTVEPLGNDRWRVHMAEYDTGIAPGQWAIFYDGEYCLGGGIIE